MPRYYFNIKDKAQTVRDEEGIDLQDLDAVREEVTVAARQIMSDKLLFGQMANDETFVVTDEQGRTVLTFPFRDAIHD
jgi:cell division FtsZ-interacting protein ZapD